MRRPAASRPPSSAGWRPTALATARSTCPSRARSTPSRIDLAGAAATAGQHHTGFWNFKAGLALRFFGALREIAEPRPAGVAARHRRPGCGFRSVLRHQLAQSTTEHGDCIEIRTSVLSGETNSETQPWAMLGLVGHPLD